MTSYFEAKFIYLTKIQNGLGTQFLIFVSHDSEPTKRGIFLVDLGSLPALDPNDQNALANAIAQNKKKLVFTNDNDPVKNEIIRNSHGHFMFDVAGNNNLLCIGWAHEETQGNYNLTLAALRGQQNNSSNNNGQVIFEKCPNASRPINNIRKIQDLQVLLIGNDPKLNHIAQVTDDKYSIEMAGH